jgi:hypothetical protein
MEGRKNMPLLFLTLDSITVNNAGGDGGFWPFDTDSEWRLNISASSNVFNYNTSFSNDSVDDGEVFDRNDSWLFVMSPGERINISVSGYESDTFFDDPLPGVTNLQLDPAAIGQDYQLTLEDADYSYTLNFDSVFV